jgi:hypothetical protein
MSKLRFTLYLITIVRLCTWSGIDRYRTQQRILVLEQQVDGIFLGADLEDWRKRHPMPDVPKKWK